MSLLPRKNKTESPSQHLRQDPPASPPPAPSTSSLPSPASEPEAKTVVPEPTPAPPKVDTPAPPAPDTLAQVVGKREAALRHAVAYLSKVVGPQSETIVGSMLTRIGHSPIPKDYPFSPRYHVRNPHRSAVDHRTNVIAHYIVWAIDKLRAYRAKPSEEALKVLDDAIARVQRVAAQWPSLLVVTGSASEGYYLRPSAEVAKNALRASEQTYPEVTVAVPPAETPKA